MKQIAVTCLTRFIVFLLSAMFALDAGASAQIALNLALGWNLVGNSSSTSIDVASKFGDSSKVMSVWKWNKTASKWAIYTPSLSSQTLSNYAASKNYDVLTTINAGEGYWINASTAYSTQLPSGSAIPATAFQATGSTALGKGWNLVSTSDSMTPSQFVTSVGGTVISLWAYDNPTSKWYFYAPSLAAKGGTALADYIAARDFLDFTATGKLLGAGVGFWVMTQ